MGGCLAQVSKKAGKLGARAQVEDMALERRGHLEKGEGWQEG